MALERAFCYKAKKARIARGKSRPLRVRERGLDRTVTSRWGRGLAVKE